MLSCKEVVKIVSTEEELPFMKKAELKLHLMMCHHCGRYMAHLKMLKSSVIDLLSRKSKNVDESTLKKLEDDVIKKTVNGDK